MAKTYRPVKFTTRKTVCDTCRVQMRTGDMFVWIEAGHNRLMRCKSCDETPPKVAEPPPEPSNASLNPRRKYSPDPVVDPKIMDTLAKVIESVNKQNSFIGTALETVNTTVGALQGQITALQQSRPVQVKIGTAPPTKPISGVHPVFKQALAVLMAGENLYMMGPQAVGKSTLVRHLAEALDAKIFKLAPGTPDSPRSLFYGFDGPRGYSGATLADAIAYDGYRIIYMEELDNTASPLQVALHDILDCAREKRESEIEFTANHRVGIVAPEKLFFVASGNTAGLGATRNHAGRRPMDSATVSRFAFLEILPQEELERTMARSFAPDHEMAALRWANYIGELRTICAKELPQLVPCARAVQRGARLIQGGTFKAASRATAYALAKVAVFRGLDEPTAQRLHKAAWAASEPATTQGGE